MMMNIFENIILLVCVLDLFSIEITIAGSCFNQMHVYYGHIWFACQPHVVHMLTHVGNSYMWFTCYPHVVTVTCGSHVNHMWLLKITHCKVACVPHVDHI